MIKTFIVIVLIFSGFTVIAQKLNDKVYQKFIHADSVVLVSHLGANMPVANEITKKRIGSIKLVNAGKPNYKIIQERYSLTIKEIDSIAGILVEKNNDSEIVDIKCFEPHHGILIFKKNKCSYFDICFSCRHFITSKYITISDELSDKTWNKLELFFRNRNFKYQMPKKEE